MDRLFRALGADWGAFKALLSVGLRMDFRGRNPGGKSRWNPIARSFVFYSLMGSTLAASLVFRTTVFTYTLLTLSYSMVMMAFAVILEFGNTLVNPDDFDILFHRPLTSRTYFMARLAHVLLFITGMGAALCVPPALVGLGVPGADWRFPLAYLPAAFAGNLTSSAFIVFLYTGLIRVLPYERFKDALAVVQIGFTFVLFFAYQLILGLGRGAESAVLGVRGSWLYAAPSAWFSGMVRVFTGQANVTEARFALIGAVVMVLLTTFGFRRISFAYALAVSDTRHVRGSVRHRPARRGRPSSRSAGLFAWKRFLDGNVRAGYELTHRMLRTDRTVKMGVYPLFGIPLAFLILSIVNGEFVDPTFQRPVWDFGLADMAGWFLLYMVYNLVLSVRFSRHWEAAWIFHAAPLGSPGRLMSGVKLALLIHLILPFFVCWAAVHAVRVSWIHGLMHTGLHFFLCLAVLAGVSFFIGDFPFSREVRRGDRTHRWVAFLLLLPVFFGLGLVQRVVYRDPLSWWAGMAILLFLGGGLELAARKRLNRVLVAREFVS